MHVNQLEVVFIQQNRINILGMTSHQKLRNSKLNWTVIDPVKNKKGKQ